MTSLATVNPPLRRKKRKNGLSCSLVLVSLLASSSSAFVVPENNNVALNRQPILLAQTSARYPHQHAIAARAVVKTGPFSHRRLGEKWRMLPPSSRDPFSQGNRIPTHLAAASPLLASTSNNGAAWWCMSLLALQFACQPILTKSFVTTKLVRTTYVVAQDMLRFLVCACVLTLTSSWSHVAGQWSVASSLVGAGLPASLYAIQNYCSLMAYQNLSPISYNVLNQTKTLSAAFFCYVLLAKAQSKLQILSLLLLLVSALVMEEVLPIRPFLFASTEQQQQQSTVTAPSTSRKKEISRNQHLTKGVLPILLASLLSGLAGTLSQQSLQELGRNPLLFSMEISVFSSLFLVLSMLTGGNPDGQRIKQGIATGWTKKTWIPLCLNAVGGILVGLVTKYAGSVRKGFALVVGLLLSGILQNIIALRQQASASNSSEDDEQRDGAVSLEQWAGGVLAAIAIWMHVSFPT